MFSNISLVRVQRAVCVSPPPEAPCGAGVRSQGPLVLQEQPASHLVLEAV